MRTKLNKISRKDVNSSSAADTQQSANATSCSSTTDTVNVNLQDGFASLFGILPPTHPSTSTAPEMTGVHLGVHIPALCAKNFTMSRYNRAAGYYSEEITFSSTIRPLLSLEVNRVHRVRLRSSRLRSVSSLRLEMEL